MEIMESESLNILDAVTATKRVRWLSNALGFDTISSYDCKGLFTWYYSTIAILPQSPRLDERRSVVGSL